jgi:competence ComEA-like helix-hairpin-helix protein
MRERPVWGFTKGERNALLLICVAVILGAGYRTWQNSKVPAEAPLTAEDSAAVAAILSAVGDPADAASVEIAAPDEVSSGAASLDTIRTVASLVNLNVAGQAELETLPGIGPVLAKRIIEVRRQLGGFQNVEELLEVSGIGSRRLDRIRSRVICPLRNSPKHPQ